jgi:ABC-type branched-subunit amino acid transport system substrate-binding protein
LSIIRVFTPGLTRPPLRGAGLYLLILISLLLPSCRWPENEIPVVKIGLVAPFEGNFRDIGYDAIYAARLAVREINETRAAGRWRLELIAYDDRGDSEMAVHAARNLVTDPSVIAVIGHYRPETTEAAAAIYAAAGLPFITVGGWGPPGNTTWHLMPDRETLLAAMLRVGGGDPESAPVIWECPHGPEAPDDAHVVDPDAVLVLSLLPPMAAGERLAEWRRAGWTGRVVGDLSFATSSFRRLAGAGVTGAAFVTPYPFPEHLPNTSGWVADYQAVGPHVPAPGVYALPTYDVVRLISEALTTLTPHRGAHRDGQGILRQDMALSLAQVTQTGWLGPIGWDEQRTWREAPLYAYRWTEQGPEYIDIIQTP